MPNTGQIISFYDSLITQLATENDRHKRVYESLDILPKGKVLDIGCGAGLTSKRLADGGREVVAVDFSPVAIEYAKQRNNSYRIRYFCSDILEFQINEQFDVICMVDVYEHLPSNGRKIIELIKKVSLDETIIYLNIPYDKTIKYLKCNFPNILQPIDEPKGIHEILTLFEYIEFIPFKMELYWMQYVEYFFCTRKNFNLFIDNTYQSLRRDTNG